MLNELALPVFWLEVAKLVLKEVELKNVDKVAEDCDNELAMEIVVVDEPKVLENELVVILVL